MAEFKLGKRSTHTVKCMVCDQTYGDAQHHRCPFSGVDHANMHREMQRRVVELEKRLDELERQVNYGRGDGE